MPLQRLPRCFWLVKHFAKQEKAHVVWTTVTSYVALRPDCLTTKGRPLSLFSSFLLTPFGSLVADISVRITVDKVIDLCMTLYHAWVFLARQRMLTK